MPAASKTSKSKSRTTKIRRDSARRKTAARAPARPSTRAARYVYVYCAVHGAVSARSLSTLPCLPDGNPPRTLPLTPEISLVVADVSAEAYAADKVEARLGDLDWVGRCGAAHHAVADTLITQHTVVPLRPFTLFSNETRATERFAAMVSQLETAIARVSGKAEWVLRIGPPESQRASTSGDGGLRATAGSGTSFLQQKAAAKRAAGELAARVRQEAARVFAALSKRADQAHERSPDPGTGLLLDATFLVRQRESESFKHELEQQAEVLLRDGCRVSLTGPWPPYSFVALDPGATRA